MVKLACLVAPTSISPKARPCSLVSSTRRLHQSGTRHQIPSPKGAKPSPGASPLILPSANVADGAIYKDLFPASQKRQPGTLPAGSQRLTSLGFHEFLVFKLMTEAKAKRQISLRRRRRQLGTPERGETPHQLSPVFAPLAGRFWSPTSLASRKDSRTTHASRMRSKQSTISSHVTPDKSFYDEAVNRRFEISADGSEIAIRDCREPRARVSAAGWKPDFAAALRAGRLLSASPSHDAAFAEKCTSVPSVASVSVRAESDPKEGARSNIKPAPDSRYFCSPRGHETAPSGRMRRCSKRCGCAT